MRLKIVYILLLVPSIIVYSQDIEFSQFFATKAYLNPAFIGLSNDNSFTTTYRNQWPSIPNAYDSYFVSYERKLKKHEAGVSAYYLSDIAGEGSLRRQSFAFQYAKHLRFSEKIFGSLGLKGSYNINSIKWDNLTWGDMIDARSGFVYATNQPRGSSYENFFDAGAGFIIYSEKLYGGIALEHINRPNIGLLSIYKDARLPIRYKLHAGGDISLQPYPNSSIVKLSPQFIFTSQAKSKQLSIGSYITYDKFTFGLWYRLKDSFIILAGIKHNNLQFGYSFDIGANNLISQSGGAHELSLTYNFEFYSKQINRKYKTISCPSF